MAQALQVLKEFYAKVLGSIEHFSSPFFGMLEGCWKDVDLLFG